MRIEQVSELFRRLNKTLKASRGVDSKYWFGQCLNPKHEDNRPSMQISSQHPHSFKCHSCGFTGTLSNIAKSMGLEIDTKIAFSDPRRVTLPDVSKLVLQEWVEPNYRGLGPEHWKYFGALKWLDYVEDPDTKQRVLQAERLFLPIYINGMFLGYTGRRTDDSEFARYKNFEGLLAMEALFPYDLWQPSHPIVLVEGPLDAIKLILYQIPAIAIFGIQNWSAHKLRLVLKKNPSTIWLCFDGDDRGQEAQEKLYHKIKNFGDVQGITLPDGVDPFDLDPMLLAQIRDDIWARHYEKVNQASLIPA